MLALKYFEFRGNNSVVQFLRNKRKSLFILRKLEQGEESYNGVLCL